MPSLQHPGPKRYPAGVRTRARALEQNQGIPYEQALAVAAGRQSIAAVLSDMLRVEKIQQLMAKHQLDRSRAILVVDKIKSLDEVLTKLRARQNVSQTPRHARLQRLKDEGVPVALEIDPDRVAIGKIQELTQYDVRLETQAGEAVTVRKLDILYFFEARELARVQKARKLDRAVAGKALAPELAPGKRTHFKHAVFQRLIESQKDTALTTRRGQTLRGKVVRFDLYEVDLKLGKGPLVTFCRHALAAID